MKSSKFIFNIFRDFVDEIKEENNFNKFLMQNEKKEENLEDNEENLIESLNNEAINENAEYYDNNYWNDPIKVESNNLDI